MVRDTWNTRACFAKYQNWGFRVTEYMSESAQPLPEHDCTKDPYCPCFQRCLHDQSCLCVPFGDTQATISLYEPPVCWSLSLKCGLSW